MTDFVQGMRAPDFSLEDFKLTDALKKSPVLLTFYKKTCPTCQMTYPFFEKIHKTFSGDKFQVIGIGQDPETKEFSDTYGVTFPMISDTPTYDVSKEYRINTVPTAFLILPNRKIEFSSIGFSKKDLQDVCSQIAKLTNRDPYDPFKGIDVPDFKAG